MNKYIRNLQGVATVIATLSLLLNLFLPGITVVAETVNEATSTTEVIRSSEKDIALNENSGKKEAIKGSLGESKQGGTTEKAKPSSDQEINRERSTAESSETKKSSMKSIVGESQNANDGPTASNELTLEEYLAQNDYLLADGKLYSTNGTDVREDLKDVLSVLAQKYGYGLGISPRAASDVVIDDAYSIKTASWTYTNGKEGSRWFAKRDDDQTKRNLLWCIEPAAPLYAGANTGFTLGQDTSTKMQKISLMAYFGYEKQKSIVNAFYTEKYSQEIATGIGVSSISDTANTVSLAGYNAFKKAVDEKIRPFYNPPSFAGKNITINAGETLTLTDENNSLAAYKVTSTPANMTVTKSGNTLTIKAISAANIADLRFAFDIDPAYVGATVVYKHATLQDVVKGRVYNPTGFDLSIKVNNEIKTNASDAEDGDKVLSPEEEVTIFDDVEYSHLFTDGRTYSIKGKLMDKQTGAPLLVNGKEVTAEKSFIPTQSSGTIRLAFTFDASVLAGKKVVVFEDLYDENIKVGTHSDLTDEGQTVEFDEPKISTTATNQDDGSKLFDPEEKVTLVDSVAYHNLQIGKTYKVSGVLMNKATGQPLVVGEEKVTGETIFTPTASDGTIDVVFEFNASALAGSELVVFEKIERQHAVDKEYRFVAKHEDLNDAGQTVEITDPKIATQATNANDGTQSFEPVETITLKDEVAYENLIEGKVYTAKGTLMDKATGKPLEINGKKVTAQTTFIAGQGEVTKEEEMVDLDGIPTKRVSGTIEVIFTFNGLHLNGKELVVFETLERKGSEIAVHADLEDEKQTVKFTDPKLATQARNIEDGTQVFDPLATVVLEDEVAYENLVEGQVYTVNGTLMDKATGKPLEINGEKVTAQTTFIAGQDKAVDEKTKDVLGSKKTFVSGKIHVTFKFIGLHLKGKELVVFESLVRAGSEIAVHADLKDKGQTVKVTEPKIGTKATNAQDGTQSFETNGTVVLNDQVTYTNLIAGKTYTVTGTLMDKATGRPLQINGQKVTASTTFVAGEGGPSNSQKVTGSLVSGKVNVVFNFNAQYLQGKEVVVFESLVREGTEIAVHADLEDENQTVNFRTPVSNESILPDLGDHSLLGGVVLGLLFLVLASSFVLYRLKNNK